MMTLRPFRILGVQQIAIGALCKTDLHKFWVEALGIEIVNSYRSTVENVDEDIARIGSGPWAVELDLMQPIDPNRPPRVHEPALNHIGLWVDDLQAAFDWLTAQRVRFTPGGIRIGAAGHPVCFIHPKGNSEFPLGGAGVLVELVQAPPELLKGL